MSGTTRLEIVIPAMLGVHTLIGIGEALITVAAIAFIEQTRPDLLSPEKTEASGGNGWVIAGLALTLLAVLISPFASAHPDGLERVAEDIGFHHSRWRDWRNSGLWDFVPDWPQPE